MAHGVDQKPFHASVPVSRLSPPPNSDKKIRGIVREWHGSLQLPPVFCGVLWSRSAPTPAPTLPIPHKKPVLMPGV